MKSFVYIPVIFCILYANIWAQFQVLDSPLLEIFAIVEGETSANITFTLSSISTEWWSVSSNPFSIGLGRSISVTPIFNADYSDYTGFNQCKYPYISPYEDFGYAVYKMALSNGRYFYLDYRDTRIPYGSPCNGHCADLWIKYNTDTGELKLYTDLSYTPLTVIDGQVFCFWELKEKGTPTTVDFPDFWKNSIGIDLKNLNPILIWGKYPNANAGTFYKLYRNLNGTSFQYLTQTTSLSYIDQSIYANSNYNYVQYYIIANTNGMDSEPTYVKSLSLQTSWPNCLSAIPTLSSDGTGMNDPYLTWSPYSSFPSGWNEYGYFVYCSINMQGGAAGIFTNIAILPERQTYFEHLGLSASLTGPWKVYYKIVPFALASDYWEITSSNVSYVRSSGYYKENMGNSESRCSWRLDQNYPNPFNPITKINYSVLNASQVTLKVFDSFGREVTTLVDEIKPEGIYETDFDASNLASGLYFYQLKTNNFVETKKMLLLK